MIIFDIDGVLSDCSHRLKYIQGNKDWDKFHENVGYDKPIVAGCYLAFTLLNSKMYKEKVVFLTGRPEKCREKTLDWLKEYLGLFGNIINENLIMREDDNHEPDTEFKRRIGERLGFKNISLVFEDRDRVVKMWRENGVICYQTCEGNY